MLRPTLRVTSFWIAAAAAVAVHLACDCGGKPPQGSVSIEPTQATVELGKTQQFKATASGSVKWSVEASPDTGSIDQFGLYQAPAAMPASPNATVVAALAGDEQVRATAAVTLVAPPARTLQSIAVTPSPATIPLGATLQLTATATYSDGSTENVTSTADWTSSNSAIATVSNAGTTRGLVTGASAGAATISAAVSGISGSASVTVGAAAVASIAVTPTNPTMAGGTTLQFAATATYTDATTQDVTAQATWTSSNAAVATVSDAAGTKGLATGIAPGTTTIGAALAGKTGSTILTVTGASLQSIAVTPANRTIAPATTLQFSATGTFSDSSTQDLTAQATWVSSNTAVATISGAGLATAVGAGSTTISAAVSGISGSTTLTVSSSTLVSIALTPATATIARNTQLQFVATGTFSDNSTQDLTAQGTWSSSNTAVATVSNASGSQGVATGVAAGTATITAALAGNSGTATLTVTAATLQSITVSPTNPTITNGTTLQFVATGAFSDSTTQDLTAQATWASSDTAVATVSNATGSEGLATAVAAGTATISATLSGITGSTTLTVVNAALVSIAVTPTNPSLAAGSTLQFTATGRYSDGSTQNLTAQATWASSDTAVATISNASGSQGLATAVAAGAGTISATLSGKTGSTTLTVTSTTLVSIAVTPTNPSIAAGTKLQFAATGSYSDGSTQNVTAQATWASSNTGVATISNASGSQGLASAVAAGTSTLSAALSGKTGSTTLTVTSATLQSIAVTPTNPSIAKGTQLPFAATGTYSDGSTQDLTAQVAWASSSTAVATITAQGLATAVSPGTSTISATLSGVSGSTTLTVTNAVLQTITVTPTNASIAKGTTLQYTATGNYSDGSSQDLTAQATWTASATAVATISNVAGSQGLATAVGPGNTSIQATLGPANGATNLTVTAATLQSIAVTPANRSIAKGTTLQYTATGTFSDTTTQDLTIQVTWASSNTTAATVSNATGSQGLATAVDVGTTTVSAALSGVTGSTSLTVTAATLQSIAVTPANPSIPIGSQQQFTATGTYSDSSTQNITTLVTWASSNTSIATVSNATGSEGLATAVAAGTATLSATLSGVSGSTLLTVTAATLQSIAVTPANPSIPKGKTQQFTATGTYSDSSTQNLTALVTWTSSNTSVATVSNASGSEGLATGVGVGSAMITAALSGRTGSATLTVTNPVLESIALSPAGPSIPAGTTQQFTATGRYTDGATQDVTQSANWSSSNTAVATVSNMVGSKGLAQGIAAGTATLSAALSGVTGSTTLTVTGATLVSIAVTPVNPKLPRTFRLQFTATGTYSDSSTRDISGVVSWTSSDTGVATVTAGGLATGLAAGTSTISAALSGKTGSTTLTVTTATLSSIAVTPASFTLSILQTQQLTATGTFSDNSTLEITTQVTWSSNRPNMASVSSTGLVTAVSKGTATITAARTGVTGTATATVP